MAPRRGGGGSFGGFSSSSASHCSTSAFETTISRVYIAFHALFFLVFVGVFYYSTVVRKRKQRTVRAPILWISLYVSITFAVLVTALNIIFLSLSECKVFRNGEFSRANIATEWLQALADFLLFLAIMFPISQRLHHGNRTMNKVILIVHSASLSVLAALLVVALSISTKVIDDIYGHRRRRMSSSYNLDEDSRNLWVAYYVFGVVCMLIAAVTMLSALVRNLGYRRGTLFVGIPCLVVSSLALTLLQLAGYVQMAFGSWSSYALERHLEQSYEAQLFLRYFFYVCTFLGVLVVGNAAEFFADYDISSRFTQEQTEVYQR
ncbi:hypothetical protein EYZ11_002429 [Aspergillus tanneri]|uniref:Uncharacterized protein n=1 Tax=Aspergillus tanneri TaxID=1220188 RepID=A0A4S3JT38_9EURO|nr:uncharacterized protein ATNIH1004_002029 [Aspergillus tanneri]KAA8641289.1 hypothetical protein ATNIH1004_002029 [Aspergillus tanneri]THC98077.1 hypothetical protein EYZ11_002429 [Aspergillus tanneri]